MMTRTTTHTRQDQHRSFAALVAALSPLAS
jgi:hypothetical protein